MALEIVFCYYVCFDKPARFHRFMVSFLNKMHLTNDHNAFLYNQQGVIECFYGYCLKNFTTGNKTPTALIQIYEQIRALYFTLKTNNGSVHSESAFLRLLSSLRGKLDLDEKCIQLLLMTCSSLGLYLTPEYLRYYLTGTNSQLKALKQEPYMLKRKDQIKQLLRCINTQLPHLVPMQVDALISIATNNNEVTSHQDMIFKNHSPYSVKLDPKNRHLIIERLNIKSMKLERCPYLLFDHRTDQGNQYVPYWLDELPRANGWIVLTSTHNYKHHLNHVPSPLRTDVLFEWSCDIMDDDISQSYLSRYKEILHTSRYYVCSDIHASISIHLNLSKEHVQSSINIVGDSFSGYQFEIDFVTDYNNSSIIGETHMCSVSSDHLCKWGHASSRYKNRFWTEKAALLHMLLFLKCENQVHWVTKLMNDTFPYGFLLLIPESMESCRCFMAAVVFKDPTDDNQIMASYVDPDGYASEAFPL